MDGFQQIQASNEIQLILLKMPPGGLHVAYFVHVPCDWQQQHSLRGFDVMEVTYQCYRINRDLHSVLQC
jgi:hypothetical protein